MKGQLPILDAHPINARLGSSSVVAYMMVTGGLHGR